MKAIREVLKANKALARHTIQYKMKLPSFQIYTIAISLLIALPVFAQSPTISDVSGLVLDGQQITITGNAFGANGPNVILFDDFKRGVQDQGVTLDATLGSWAWSSASNGYNPNYENDSDGNIAARLIGSNGNGGRLKFRFSDAQEIYVSYRVIIPAGEHFPNTTAPNTFSNGSDWKLVWLMDGDRGAAGNDDLCLPTSNNPVDFTIGGNDNAFQTKTGKKSGDLRWFSFENWNRFSVYLKGGANPTVDTGIVWAQGMSQEFGQKVFEDNPVIFDGDDTPDGYQFEDDDISRWNQLNVPGWSRSNSVNPGALYDDIYVATGGNARARIEIGNRPVYSDSTVLAIATPTSWQDNSITTTVRQGSFQDGQRAYLFIIDKDGNISDGYPFVFGSTVDQPGPTPSRRLPGILYLLLS